MNYIATFYVSQNTINIRLAYMLHVFGKRIDTSLENKYKYVWACYCSFVQDEVEAKAAEK